MNARARAMPGTTTPRNGLPPGGGYVYQGSGKDTLTPPSVMRAWQEHGEVIALRPARQRAEEVPVQAGDAARLAELEAGLAARGILARAAVTRPAPPAAAAPASAAPAPVRDACERCDGCGYLTSARGHELICGDGA